MNQIRRPNGGAPRHNGAVHGEPPPPTQTPAAPAAPPTPQAPVVAQRDWTFNDFSGTTGPLTLQGGYWLCTWTAPSAAGDLFLEWVNAKNQWSGVRCFNVMTNHGTSGFTLAGSALPQFRVHFAGLGTASITLSGPA
jgi:hypothetical protein